jgi:hypothetical protein
MSPSRWWVAVLGAITLLLTLALARRSWFATLVHRNR